jgi:hypothetical protein
VNTLIPATGLCGYAELRCSGIWDATSAPSLRVLQRWSERRMIPTHLNRGKTLFLVHEVAEALRKHYWLWPKTMALPSEIALMSPLEWRLVRFNDLADFGLWSVAKRPCKRTLRTMVGTGLIPHYQISGTLFFQAEEVRHCIFDGTLTSVAA